MKHVCACRRLPEGPAAVAFGSFDGMHLGHRAVIDALCGHAGERPVLISFADTVNPVVYTEEEKAYLLRDSAVDTMFSMPAAEARAMNPEAFARDILVGMLHAKTVVMGAGNKDLVAYEALGKIYGFAVEAVPTVCYEGEAVTTDGVKQCIRDNDFVRMHAMLGDTYVMLGVVVHGKAEGRKHGMPTANLGMPKNKLYPPLGVFGTLSHIDGESYRGITNIGLRPSDDDIPIPTVETFILNFDKDIYGKEVILEVLVYVRGIRKFAGGLDEVRKQIDKDIEQIRVYMDEHCGPPA